MKRFLACVAVQNMVDRRPSVRCMHPIPGGRATLASVKQVAVKPYSHVHDPACSSCFFEDQGLTGLINKKHSADIKKNDWPLIKYDIVYICYIQLSFNLEWTMNLKLQFLTKRSQNKKHKMHSANLEVCRRYQRPQLSRHWQQRWPLTVHVAEPSLLIHRSVHQGKKLHAFHPSTQQILQVGWTRWMGSKAWELVVPNGRDDCSNFCKDINQKKSIPMVVSPKSKVMDEFRGVFNFSSPNPEKKNAFFFCVCFFLVSEHVPKFRKKCGRDSRKFVAKKKKLVFCWATNRHGSIPKPLWRIGPWHSSYTTTIALSIARRASLKKARSEGDNWKKKWGFQVGSIIGSQL